eukprot:TRINITY_DN23563_c0_g1_i1.p1 TRINITY_DN23563_c0_g1~~TRINITY_DN23563_c0_g1_i1.p1  ORF type:complete len:261 (+),score=25.52 TRINITY_DN23563_c0_g1_i1:124-906(+)
MIFRHFCYFAAWIPLTASQSVPAIEKLPAIPLFSTFWWVIYDDEMHLPPGVISSDLVGDEAFKRFVVNLIHGQLVLPSHHVETQELSIREVVLMEDHNAQAINSHGGIVEGKKRIKILAQLRLTSEVVAEQIARVPLLTTAGLAQWRKLHIYQVCPGEQKEDAVTCLQQATITYHVWGFTSQGDGYFNCIFPWGLSRNTVCYQIVKYPDGAYKERRLFGGDGLDGHGQSSSNTSETDRTLDKSTEIDFHEITVGWAEKHS